MTATGATVALRNADSSAALRIALLGANASSAVIGTDALDGEVNYFGNAGSQKAIGHVARYARVTYSQVYPGIDWVHYGNDSRLEHDFVVAPNVDPAAIRLSFEGADRLEVDAPGDLLVHTAAGVLRQPKPVIYQPAVATKHRLNAVVGGVQFRGRALCGHGDLTCQCLHRCQHPWVHSVIFTNPS